jgi:peroxiredoxin
LQGAKPEFDAAGVRLVLIGQAQPSDAAAFRRQFELELPVLADARRESYNAVGAKMAGVTGLFGPKVVIRGVKTLLGAKVMQGKTVGHPSQLGAALVLAGGDGATLYRQIAQDASDNAPAEDLLAAATAATPEA